MQNKIRVNMANPAELRELPGVGSEQADTILRFRAQHGPIREALGLCRVPGWPRTRPRCGDRQYRRRPGSQSEIAGT